MKFRFCGDLDCPDWLLAEISTLSNMAPGVIRFLLKQILLFIFRGEYDCEKILLLASETVDGLSDIKGSIAALHFMVTSAAKYDLAEGFFVQEILQLGMPKENADVVASLYRRSKDDLRLHFSESRHLHHRLASTDWRVDRIITSASPYLIHLNLTIDAPPSLSSSQETNPSSKIIAFQLDNSKLDLMISELSKAQKLMESIGV
eukprot:gene27363-36130_t